MIAYIELTSDGSAFKNTYILPHGDRVRQGNGFTLHVLIKNGYVALPNFVSVYAEAINGTSNPNPNPIYNIAKNAGYYFRKLYPTEITYGLKNEDSCTEYTIEIPRDSDIVTYSGSISLVFQAHEAVGEDGYEVENAQRAELSVEKVYAKPREHSNISQTQADALASLIVNNFSSQESYFVLDESMFDRSGSEVKLSARPANGFGIVSGKVVTKSVIEASNIDEESTAVYNVKLISEVQPFSSSAVAHAILVAEDLAEKGVEAQNAWVKNYTISSADDKATGKIICSAQTAAALKSISDLGLITSISYNGTYGEDSEHGYRYADITVTYKNTRFSDWVLVGSVDATGWLKMTSPSVSFADSLGYGEFRLTYEGPDANNPNIKGYVHLWIQKGISEIPAGSVFDLTLPIAITQDYVSEISNSVSISSSDSSVSVKANNIVFAKTLLENINGRPLSRYSTEDVSDSEYPYVKILCEGSENITASNLKAYLKAITGTEHLPEYDYNYPLNTYAILADGSVYKLQVDNGTAEGTYRLKAYVMSIPFVPYNGATADLNLGSHSVSASSYTGSAFTAHATVNEQTKTGQMKMNLNGQIELLNVSASGGQGKSYVLPIDENGNSFVIATRSWVNNNKSDSYLHTVGLSYQNIFRGYIKFISSSYNEYSSVSDIARDFNAGTIRDVKYSTDGDNYFLVYAMSSTGDIGYITFSSTEIDTVDEIGGYINPTKL